MSEKLNVEVGDAVVVRSSWNNSYLSKVERITPKGAIRVNGILYDEYGREKGSNVWNRSHITKATEEDVKQIEEEKFITLTLVKLRKIKELSYEQAVEIERVLRDERR